MHLKQGIILSSAIFPLIGIYLNVFSCPRFYEIYGSSIHYSIGYCETIGYPFESHVFIIGNSQALQSPNNANQLEYRKRNNLDIFYEWDTTDKTNTISRWNVLGIAGNIFVSASIAIALSAIIIMFIGMFKRKCIGIAATEHIHNDSMQAKDTQYK